MSYENSANEVSGLLSYLRSLERELNLALVLLGASGVVSGVVVASTQGGSSRPGRGSPYLPPFRWPKPHLVTSPQRHSAILRANPASGDLKSGAETIPEFALSPRNPAHFRQKQRAAPAVPGSISKNGGESGIRTRCAGFTRTKD